MKMMKFDDIQYNITAVYQHIKNIEANIYFNNSFKIYIFQIL